MAYLEKESQGSQVFERLSRRLGELVLKKRTEGSDYAFAARQGCNGCSSYMIREEPELPKLCTCQANEK